MSRGDGLRSELPPWAMVPEWVLDSEISDGALRLYVALARWANKDTGASFPARKTIANRLRCSTDTVDRRLKELAEIGAVEKRPFFTKLGDRGSNTYVIKISPPSRADAATPRGGGDVAADARLGERGDAAVTRDRELETEKEAEQASLLGDGDPALAPPEPKPRPRNEIFDAIADVFPAQTESERKRVAKVVAELRKLDPVPSPDDVRRRAEWVRREWPTASPMAISSAWSRIGETLGARDSRAADPVELTGGMDQSRESRRARQ